MNVIAYGTTAAVLLCGILSGYFIRQNLSLHQNFHQGAEMFIWLAVVFDIVFVLSTTSKKTAKL